MIVTVTLNPSIDIKYNLDKFLVGRVHRVISTTKTAGGKGLNVTRVIKKLGGNVLATGFLGGDMGGFISTSLSNLGIIHKFTNIEENTRNCINIISEANSTEILEKGPNISSKEWNNFKKNYTELVSENKNIVISGSLPSGLKEESYLELLEIGKSYNCKIFLDTSGDTLKKSIMGKPYFIKPNLEELENLVGRKLESIEDIISEGKKLNKTGIEIVAITLGEKGAIILTDNTSYIVTIPKFNVVNTVGSGDSFVAGFVTGCDRKLSLTETIKLAVSCSISNALQEKTGDIDVENMEKIKKLIKIEEVEG